MRLGSPFSLNPHNSQADLKPAIPPPHNLLWHCLPPFCWFHTLLSAGITCMCIPCIREGSWEELAPTRCQPPWLQSNLWRGVEWTGCCPSLTPFQHHSTLGQLFFKWWWRREGGVNRNQGRLSIFATNLSGQGRNSIIPI